MVAGVQGIPGQLPPAGNKRRHGSLAAVPRAVKLVRSFACEQVTSSLPVLALQRAQRPALALEPALQLEQRRVPVR
ncbi:MAG TPA: hypothetical protein PKA30_15020, partial [Accumulibacter sp.]|uniref:hypothetical protein n=1 Tax=Accumulibacter sp. TaxID=2053492 RepID=UPI002C54D544